MRWKISPHFHFRLWPSLAPKGHHDPRTIDLLVIIALIAVVLGSGWYLETSFVTPPSSTAYIVPSQSVRW